MTEEPSAMAMIQVLLLDDHPVVTEGLRSLLDRQADIEVIGEALTLDQALETRVEPDVVVADLVLGERRGAEVVDALRARFAAAAVLALTMVDDPVQVKSVLLAGARGYLLKDAAADELVDAVRRVARGEDYLQPSVGAALARSIGAATARAESVDLTEREREIVRLLALGHTNAEIASVMAVSVRTVESHRAHLLGKLGVRTRAELLRRAVELGLVDISSH